MSATEEKDQAAGDNKDTESSVQVHSANSWETADLGGKQRNEKFLRLMGAGKKEHHGKIVIGDQNPAHKRERKEDQHLAEELAEQYEHSMEYRLAGGRRGHLGLGYHPESPEKKDKPESETVVEETGVEAKVEEEPEEDAVPETAEAGEKTKNTEKEGGESQREEGDSSREKDERKRESVDSSSDEPDVKKLKFVKAGP